MYEVNMAKDSGYEVMDYGDRWDANAISHDMTTRASKGWEVLQVLTIPQRYEVSRYPDNAPGLNDGDSVIASATMRVVYRK